jgi:hypothetical protein
MSLCAGHADEDAYGLATWHQVITCNSGERSAQGDQIYTCNFGAPDRCRIVSATATPIGGPASESLDVTVAADGTRVTAVFITRLGEAADARALRRPKISITAKLRCRDIKSGS